MKLKQSRVTVITLKGDEISDDLLLPEHLSPVEKVYWAELNLKSPSYLWKSCHFSPLTEPKSNGRYLKEPIAIFQVPPRLARRGLKEVSYGIGVEPRYCVTVIGDDSASGKHIPISVIEADPHTFNILTQSDEDKGWAYVDKVANVAGGVFLKDNRKYRLSYFVTPAEPTWDWIRVAKHAVNPSNASLSREEIGLTCAYIPLELHGVALVSNDEPPVEIPRLPIAQVKIGHESIVMEIDYHYQPLSRGDVGVDNLYKSQLADLAKSAMGKLGKATKLIEWDTSVRLWTYQNWVDWVQTEPEKRCSVLQVTDRAHPFFNRYAHYRSFGWVSDTPKNITERMLHSQFGVWILEKFSEFLGKGGDITWQTKATFNSMSCQQVAFIIYKITDDVELSLAVLDFMLNDAVHHKGLERWIKKT